MLYAGIDIYLDEVSGDELRADILRGLVALGDELGVLHGSDGGGRELAGGGVAAKGRETVLAPLVGDEEHVLVLVGAEGHAAGLDAGGGDGFLKREGGGLVSGSGGGEDEMRDVVGVVARQPVRDVDVLLVGGDEDGARGRRGGVLGRRRAPRRLLRDPLERDALGVVVLDLVEHDDVARLARHEEVGFAAAADEAAVAWSGAGEQGDGVDDVELVARQAQDEDLVAAQVGDDHEAAGGVEDGLVRVVLRLLGAQGPRDLDALHELRHAGGRRVPDVEVLAAVARADHAGLVLVELEEDDARGAVDGPREGRPVGLEVEHVEVGAVLVDGVQRVGRVLVAHPARRGSCLEVLARDGEGGSVELGDGNLTGAADDQVVRFCGATHGRWRCGSHAAECDEGGESSEHCDTR